MSPLLEAGLNVTAIGMGVVFVLLTSLVFIIRGMSALARVFEGPARPAATTGGTSAAQPVPQNEVVSVIGAAIMAHRKRQQDISKGN